MAGEGLSVAYQKPTDKPSTAGYTARGTIATGLAVLADKVNLMVMKAQPTSGNISTPMSPAQVATITAGSLTAQFEDANLYVSGPIAGGFPFKIFDMNLIYKSNGVVNVDHADIIALRDSLRADTGDAALLIKTGYWSS